MSPLTDALRQGISEAKLTDALSQKQFQFPTGIEKFRYALTKFMQLGAGEHGLKR